MLRTTVNIPIQYGSLPDTIVMASPAPGTYRVTIMQKVLATDTGTLTTMIKWNDTNGSASIIPATAISLTG